MAEASMTDHYGQLKLIDPILGSIKSFPLKLGINTIGSSPQVDIRLYETGVLALHFYVEVKDNNMAVISTFSNINSTYLNDKLLRKGKSELIEPSDVIAFSKIKMVYENNLLDDQVITQFKKNATRTKFFSTPRHCAFRFRNSSRRSLKAKKETQQWRSDVLETPLLPSSPLVQEMNKLKTSNQNTADKVSVNTISSKPILEQTSTKQSNRKNSVDRIQNSFREELSKSTEKLMKITPKRGRQSKTKESKNFILQNETCPFGFNESVCSNIMEPETRETNISNSFNEEDDVKFKTPKSAEFFPPLVRSSLKKYTQTTPTVRSKYDTSDIDDVIVNQTRRGSKMSSDLKSKTPIMVKKRKKLLSSSSGGILKNDVKATLSLSLNISDRRNCIPKLTRRSIKSKSIHLDTLINLNHEPQSERRGSNRLSSVVNRSDHFKTLSVQNSSTPKLKRSVSAFEPKETPIACDKSVLSTLSESSITQKDKKNLSDCSLYEDTNMTTPTASSNSFVFESPSNFQQGFDNVNISGVNLLDASKDVAVVDSEVSDPDTKSYWSPIYCSSTGTDESEIDTTKNTPRRSTRKNLIENSQSLINISKNNLTSSIEKTSLEQENTPNEVTSGSIRTVEIKKGRSSTKVNTNKEKSLMIQTEQQTPNKNIEKKTNSTRASSNKKSVTTPKQQIVSQTENGTHKGKISLNKTISKVLPRKSSIFENEVTPRQNDALKREKSFTFNNYSSTPRIKISTENSLNEENSFSRTPAKKDLKTPKWNTTLKNQTTINSSITPEQQSNVRKMENGKELSEGKLKKEESFVNDNANDFFKISRENSTSKNDKSLVGINTTNELTEITSMSMMKDSFVTVKESLTPQLNSVEKSIRTRAQIRKSQDLSGKENECHLESKTEDPTTLNEDNSTISTIPKTIKSLRRSLRISSSEVQQRHSFSVLTDITRSKNVSASRNNTSLQSFKVHVVSKTPKSNNATLERDKLNKVGGVKQLLNDSQHTEQHPPLNHLTDVGSLEITKFNDLTDVRGNDLSDITGVKNLLTVPKKQRSPNNDLRDVRGVKKLLKTPKPRKEPRNDLSDVTGVKKLFTVPKEQHSPNNDLTDVRGVKKILKTPKLRKEPRNDLSDVTGVKKLFSVPKEQHSPNNDLTDVRGVKKILKTPKPRKEPRNDLSDVTGVKKLFTVPKEQHSPNNDLTDVRGVKKFLKTPKPRKEPRNDLSDVTGVKKLFTVPKEQHSPNNDLTNVQGVKKLLKTPKPRKEPHNELTDVRGVKKLLKTPKFAKEPLNDLSDVVGVKNLFLSAHKRKRSPENDLINIELKRLTKSPKPIHSTANDLPDIMDGKKLLASAKKQLSPLSDMKGVRRSMRTSQKSPKSDLRDVTGLYVSSEEQNSPNYDLPNTPKQHEYVLNVAVTEQEIKRTTKRKNTMEISRNVKKFKSSDVHEGDYTNVAGIKRMFAEAEANYRTNINLSGVADLFQDKFDKLTGKEPLRQYPGKSSPTKLSPLAKRKSMLDSSAMHDSNVQRWINEQNKTLPNTSTPITREKKKITLSDPISLEIQNDESPISTEVSNKLINSYATRTLYKKVDEIEDHEKYEASPSAKLEKAVPRMRTRSTKKTATEEKTKGEETKESVVVAKSTVTRGRKTKPNLQVDDVEDESVFIQNTKRTRGHYLKKEVTESKPSPVVVKKTRTQKRTNVEKEQAETNIFHNSSITISSDYEIEPKTKPIRRRLRNRNVETEDIAIIVSDSSVMSHTEEAKTEDEHEIKPRRTRALRSKKERTEIVNKVNEVTNLNKKLSVDHKKSEDEKDVASKTSSTRSFEQQIQVVEGRKRGTNRTRQGVKNRNEVENENPILPRTRRGRPATVKQTVTEEDLRPLLKENGCNLEVNPDNEISKVGRQRQTRTKETKVVNNNQLEISSTSESTKTPVEKKVSFKLDIPEKPITRKRGFKEVTVQEDSTNKKTKTNSGTNEIKALKKSAKERESRFSPRRTRRGVKKEEILVKDSEEVAIPLRKSSRKK